MVVIQEGLMKHNMAGVETGKSSILDLFEISPPGILDFYYSCFSIYRSNKCMKNQVYCGKFKTSVGAYDGTDSRKRGITKEKKNHHLDCM